MRQAFGASRIRGGYRPQQGPGQKGIEVIEQAAGLSGKFRKAVVMLKRSKGASIADLTKATGAASLGPI